jgi:hypothetical protein
MNDHQGSLFPEMPPAPAARAKSRKIWTCLWPNCGIDVSQRNDLCDDHWKLLPIPLRARVAVAFQDKKPISDELATVIRRWVRDPLSVDTTEYFTGMGIK